MLDYKDIITRHYALEMSGSAIAELLGVSPSGVNDFLRAFKACPTPDYPLPEGITNYAIAEAVCGKNPAFGGRDPSYEMQDYAAVEKEMSSRKYMTLRPVPQAGRWSAGRVHPPATFYAVQSKYHLTVPLKCSIMALRC